MAQEDIFKFFFDQRKNGEEKFFSAKEVRNCLKEEKGLSDGALHGVSGDISRLEFCGFLEARCQGKFNDWNRCFRLRKKYIDGEK